MPTHISLDSLTSEKNLTDKDERQIVVHYVDPPTEKNPYRFMHFVNSEQVKTIFTLDDEFTNGRVVHSTLRLGANPDVKIIPGDTATVEMQCIDAPFYTIGTPSHSNRVQACLAGQRLLIHLAT